MKLNEDFPLDHRLAQVYRVGAAAVGLFLIIFGILGLVRSPAVTGRSGIHVAGLSSDGLLSGVSILVGAILVVAAMIGGNVASTVNIGAGLLFLLSGIVNLAFLRTSLNIFAFEVRNVIFSFIVGVALLTFGFYGRVSGGLTEENPYVRARHGLPPRERERAEEVQEEVEAEEEKAERLAQEEYRRVEARRAYGEHRRGSDAGGGG